MNDKTPAAGAAPQENKMGVQPIGRLLASMAIPMMLSMLVQALYNVVDSVFVSRISENALNAVSLAFPLQNLMIAVGAGTAVGINALLSRSLGDKKQEMADRAAGTGIFLSLCNAVAFALIGIFLSRAFFMSQAKSVPEIVEMGTAYTRICLGLSVGLFCQFCFERLLQSTGRTVLAMATQMIGAVINIVLDPVFIFGLCGMPRLGVTGAAVATVLGQFVGALLAILLNLKRNPDIHIRLRLIRPDRRVAKEIYRVGVPSIVMQSIGSVMTFGMNKILFVFTPTATAVFGAYFKIQSFIFMPVFGLNNGMLPIISYNYGAARMDRVKRTVKLTICTAVCIMTAGFAVFQLAPATLLALFDASAEMTAIGVPALRIISISFLLAGFCIISGSVCQAIGNPLYSMVVSICRQLVVLLPAAWLLAQTGRLELVWWSFPIAEIASVTLSAIFLRRTMRSAGAKLASRKASLQTRSCSRGSRTLFLSLGTFLFHLFFSLIHPLVRPGKQGILRLLRPGAPGGALGHRHLIGQSPALLLQILIHGLLSVQKLLVGGVLQNRQELVAADPVASPQALERLPDALRRGDDGRVSRGMAVVVIDALQVIQVKQHVGDPVRHLRLPLLQRHPVFKPRQSV